MLSAGPWAASSRPILHRGSAQDDLAGALDMPSRSLRSQSGYSKLPADDLLVIRCAGA